MEVEWRFACSNCQNVTSGKTIFFNLSQRWGTRLVKLCRIAFGSWPERRPSVHVLPNSLAQPRIHIVIAALLCLSMQVVKKEFLQLQPFPIYLLSTRNLTANPAQWMDCQKEAGNIHLHWRRKPKLECSNPVSVILFAFMLMLPGMRPTCEVHALRRSALSATAKSLVTLSRLSRASKMYHNWVVFFLVIKWLYTNWAPTGEPTRASVHCKGYLREPTRVGFAYARSLYASTLL